MLHHDKQDGIIRNLYNDAIIDIIMSAIGWRTTHEHRVGL